MNLACGYVTLLFEMNGASTGSPNLPIEFLLDFKQRKSFGAIMNLCLKTR